MADRSSTHPDDWFRSASWDEAARAEFVRRLGRARPFNRVQYRRIKALALLDADDPVRQEAGRAMLEENLAGATTEDFEWVLASVRLAKHERSAGNLDAAERLLRDALRIAGPEGRALSGEEDTMLAEILLERGGTERVAEAQALLDHRAEAMPLFARSRFRLCVAHVRVAQARSRKADARAWAVAALEVAASDHSGLAHHPRLGLVETDAETLAWLQDVATGDA